MNERPDVGDAALRELLEQRARHAQIDGRLAAIRSAAAETPQRRPARLHLGFAHGAAGAAGAAALGVLVVVLAIAFGGLAPAAPIGVPASSAPPSSGSSFGPSSGPPATPVIPGAAEPVLPLTVDELNSILLPNSQALLGRLLVITGKIDFNPPEDNPVFGPQASAPVSQEVLVGAVPSLRIEIAAAASLPGPMPWTGTFAARMTDTRTIEFLEPVTLASGGVPLKPSQLPSLSARTRASGYVLAQGWIAGFDVALPCPAPVATPPPGPQYSGCGVTSSLSDSAAQPVSGTSFEVPDDGVQVQDRAYDDFAPDPQLIKSGTQPELATFLVMPVYETPCAPGDFCPFQPLKDHWQIVARIDPWPTPGETAPPTGAPTPSPTASPAAIQPVQPLTVAQLNAFVAMNSQSPEGRQLVITGTIEPMTPIPSCVTLTNCPPLVLKGSNPRLEFDTTSELDGVDPVIDRPSTFAATLNGFTLSYQAAVSTNADGVPWLPGQLPSAAAAEAGNGYWLVHGWIGISVGTPSCPVGETPYLGPQYTCAIQSALGDSAHDTQTFVGANDLPHTLRIQNGAYESFAPEPGQAGEPEQATFLVRATYVPACGPTVDCLIPPSNYHWAIVARIDPWPVPALP